MGIQQEVSWLSRPGSQRLVGTDDVVQDLQFREPIAHEQHRMVLEHRREKRLNSQVRVVLDVVLQRDHHRTRDRIGTMEMDYSSAFREQRGGQVFAQVVLWSFAWPFRWFRLATHLDLC